MDSIEPVVVLNNDKVYPMIFTPEIMERFWNRAKDFPVLYNHNINNDINEFIDLFFYQTDKGYVPKGLFWVLNPEQFTGVFFLENIKTEHGMMKDANVHYTFFDRRHNGRVPLIREMLKFVFTKYQFQRLTAEIPNYNTPQARVFAQQCGFALEGKRRKSAYYKDTWFDTNLYGILQSEVLR